MATLQVGQWSPSQAELLFAPVTVAKIPRHNHIKPQKAALEKFSVRESLNLYPTQPRFSPECWGSGRSGQRWPALASSASPA